MSASNVSVSNVETVSTVVDQSTKKGDAVQAVHQLLDGVTPVTKTKKPRAPKKVKEVVDVEGEASVEGDAPSVPTEPSTKAKKPRAPKKVKEAVVAEGDVPVEGDAPVAEPSVPPTKAKKPRAPKKVSDTVDVVSADGVDPIDSSVVPSVPSVPEPKAKKPRAPKKVKEAVVAPVVLVPEEVVRSTTTMPNTIEQCINAIKYLNRTEGKTCDQIKQMVDDIMDLELAFDDMKIGDAPTNNGLEKMDVEKEVVEEKVVEEEVVEEEVVEEKVDEADVEDEEVEEELLTTEFTLDGEIYLKDSKDNLYDRSPPHDFIRNLRE